MKREIPEKGRKVAITPKEEMTSITTTRYFDQFRNAIAADVFDWMLEKCPSLKTEMGIEEDDQEDAVKKMVKLFKKDAEKVIVKPKKAPKVATEEERCVAVKNDGGRCTQKKSKKEEHDKEMCAIHNRTPPVKRIDGKAVKEKPPKKSGKKESESESEGTKCTMPLMSGKRKGEECGVKAIKGKHYCKRHQKKAESESESVEEREDPTPTPKKTPGPRRKMEDSESDSDASSDEEDSEDEEL